MTDANSLIESYDRGFAPDTMVWIAVTRGNWQIISAEITTIRADNSTLRNDLTAARLERDALGALLADHNAGCKMDCEARKNCEPYTRRGRKCPDCPQHYVIELPSDPHPSGSGT